MQDLTSLLHNSRVWQEFASGLNTDLRKLAQQVQGQQERTKRWINVESNDKNSRS
jgi:hypothetical protein